MRAARYLAAVVLLVSTACAGTAQVQTTSAAASQPITTELALLTFDSAWSRVAHTHYDTAFGGVDWNAVKTELRPRAARVTTLAQLREVISTMLSRLGQSHYGLIPREASPALSNETTSAPSTGDAGVELRLVDGALLVWRVDPEGPGATAGVKTGWRVVAIDNTPIQPRLDALARVPAAQQRTARTRLLYQLNGLLHGTSGQPVTMKLEPGSGAAVDRVIVRREQPGQLVQFGNLPPFVAQLTHERLNTAAGCVGIIQLNGWFTAIGPAFDRAVDTMRECKGIVIDIRGNPGGMAGMVMGTAGHFLGDTLPLGFMKARTGVSTTTVLRFKANPRRVRADGSSVEPYSGPVAILTDEMSASTSEFFAAGLQGVGRARVFGRNSAGQALPAMLVRLPTDDVLMHVVADFTGPGGVRIEGRGVQPDVPVADTRADLLEQRDAPLRAALEWIASAAPRTDEQPSGGNIP